MQFDTEVKVLERRNVRRRKLKGDTRRHRPVRVHRPSVYIYLASLPQDHITGKPVKAAANV